MAKKKKNRKPGPGGFLSPGVVRALVLVAILILIGGAIAFFVLRARGRSSILAAHEPGLNKYLSIAQAGNAPESFLPGKVVTVDVAARAIDPLFLDLPEDCIARNPEEVSAVVLLDWQMKDTGLVVYRKDRPDVKVPLYDRTCAITVVDSASGLVTARGTVHAKTNPDKHSADDILEGRPTSQVLEFLGKLPRK